MFRLAVTLATVLVVFAAPAHAQLAGYDGTNPFDCELQQAGLGTDFPNPGADPFCVEYDKTQQNVTQLGLVQFLSQEPARFAAAGDKCFYFQHDHWRGSIVQENEATETYSWDGSYWFDKARGAGGVHVENFTLNNQTGDPTQLPGFPEEYKPFFGPGRGGVQGNVGVKADPRCVAVVRDEPRDFPYRCSDRSGAIGADIGGIRLGMSKDELEAALGPAARQHLGFMRYCTMQGGKLAAGLSRGVVRFVLTTSTAFDFRGARVGGRASALRGERRLSRRGRSVVYVARAGRGRVLLAGVRNRRVRWLALAPAGLDRRRIASFLTRSR